MFEKEIYIQRRTRLKEQLESGLVLFLGNEESAMNYPANPYPFRQDSSFLYFFGLDFPSLTAIIDVDANKDILFGDDLTVEDIVWMGEEPSMKDRASLVGVENVEPSQNLQDVLKKALQEQRKIHFLPPYRMETRLKIEKMIGIHPSVAKQYASRELIQAVVEQRSVKSQEEIEQMEIAHEISYDMYQAALDMIKPGVYEREIVGQMEGIALRAGCYTSFPTILTINGQILHNHYHGNILKEGQLVVGDSGVESPLHYASDITRTYPVSGKFSAAQKEIYSLVLKSQEAAIASIKPGIKYKDVHLKTARVITEGLQSLGFLKGDLDELIEKGAHALFFPHGLGHMIGLDVHDMEDLGENFVGYDDRTKRSEQFGIAYLRFGRELKKGFALTVEPGIYFIPALIDKWKSEKRFLEHIDYNLVDQFRGFGGIRIEDDVVVTDNGCRVLGKNIPKQVKEIEERLS